MNPKDAQRIYKRSYVRSRDGALAILLAALRILESRAAVRKARLLLSKSRPA